jgi:hypothetical protein
MKTSRREIRKYECDDGLEIDVELQDGKPVMVTATPAGTGGHSLVNADVATFMRAMAALQECGVSASGLCVEHGPYDITVRREGTDWWRCPTCHPRAAPAPVVPEMAAVDS